MMNRIECEKRAAALGYAAFEKEASWLSGLGGLYKGIRGLGTGLFGRAGTAITKAVAPHSPGASKWLRMAGRGMPQDMWGMGMLFGGLGALTNPEDRLGGFARGFGAGALGGIGWRAGSNLARQGIARTLGRTQYGKGLLQGVWGKRLVRPLSQGQLAAQQAARKAGIKITTPSWWQRLSFRRGPAGEAPAMTGGQWAKLLGQKAAIGAIPLGTALYASGLTTPNFEGSAPAPAPAYPPMQMPPQAYYAQYPGYY